MKRIILHQTMVAVLLSFFAFTSVSQAQYTGAKDAISFGTVGAWEGFDFDDDDFFDLGGYEYGAWINYYHGFNNTFGLEVPLQLGLADLKKPDSEDISDNAGYINTGILGRVQYFKSNRQVLVPYARAGLGIEYSEVQDFRGWVPLGIGFDLRLAHHIYLTAGADYRFGFDEDNERMNVNAGIKLMLGDGQAKPKDKDGDGVSDDVDVCPEVAGLIELFGCPDGDGDGVRDSEDKCPGEFGPSENDGCPWPDSDADGVKDNVDECPDVAGVAALGGCPDGDGDGIRDSEDRCPRVAGLARFGGCPDRDNDGIQDSEDECPTEAGPADNNGCPKADGDGDGVPDDIDKCPNVKGPASTQGCPDRDGDGVMDLDDKCPQDAGPASNGGCPELEEEEKEIIEIAARAIQFETGSSTLTASSLNVLDQIADIMKKYPNKRLSISGYTDSVGSADSNQRLSERRAKACYDKLVNSGINTTRMSYAGYGEINPIADNSTKEGQARNRRVVFEVRD